MSNVIAFIEKMGQDAQLRHASRSEVEFALAESQIDLELRAPIIGKDQAKLEALLGGNTITCNVFFCGDNDDEREGETCLAQCA